jgi:hypothetical protein
MKSKFFIRLSLLILFLTGLSLAGALCYRPLLLRTSQAFYLDKLDRLAALAEQPAPKAVFVGGSATLFGVHTELFEKTTGIPSVNMGMDAGTRFKIYLEAVKPYLKPGDFLFILPEYQYFYTDFKEVNPNLFNLLLCRPSLARCLDASQYPQLLSVSLISGWQAWNNLTIELMQEHLMKSGYGVYYRTNANAWGDMIGHKDLPQRDYGLLSFPRIPIPSSFLNGMEAYIREYTARGIHVYLIPPPMDKRFYEAEPEAFQSIAEQFRQLGQLCVPLGTLEDSTYPPEVFYDTVYHLNWQTGEEYTRKIIRAFQSQTGTASE